MSEPKKRQKKIPKKSEVPKTISPSQNPDLEKLDQVKIEQLLNQTKLRYKEEAAIENKIKLKEVSQLSYIAEEYLNCFLILGYSAQDEKVIVWNARTGKDEAALTDLLRNTFMDVMGNRS